MLNERPCCRKDYASHYNRRVRILRRDVIYVPARIRAKLIITLSNVILTAVGEILWHGRSAKRLPARIVRDPVVLVSPLEVNKPRPRAFVLLTVRPRSAQKRRESRRVLQRARCTIYTFQSVARANKYVKSCERARSVFMQPQSTTRHKVLPRK